MPACWSTCRIWRESGADGIGLFRTELQFMMSAPSRGSSGRSQLYRAVVG